MSGPSVIIATHLLEQSIAGFALHALWQVPLMAGAAWLAIRIGQANVRVAHVLWSLTLALCVLVPGLSTIAGRHAAVEAERAARAASVSYSGLDYDGVLPEIQRESLWMRVLHRHVNANGLQPFSFALPSSVARGITVAYLLMVAYFTLRLFIAWRRSGHLVRNPSSEPLPDHVAAVLHRQCAMLHMDEPFVGLSNDIAGPALAGVRKPTLLLPTKTAEEMTSTEIDAVLAHELAHLRRRDPLMHALSSLLLIPVGFHPAAVWVARRVRQTREMACDADAAEQMGSPAQYAHALLQVAERTGGGPAHMAGPFVTGLGLFTTGLGFLGTSLELFGAGGAMEERMETLMHGRDETGRRHRVLRAGVSIGLGAVAVLAAVMVQVQPALAAGQSAAQNTTHDAASKPTADNEPQRLLGGDHARGQLRDARRRLDEAEQHATTDEERNKISAARGLAELAENQIAAASGHDQRTVTIHADRSIDMQLKDLDAMGASIAMQIGPDSKVHVMQLQMDEQSRLLNEKLKAQFDSPEWKAQIARDRAEAEKIRAQVNSPEWKAQMARNLAEAEKIKVQVNSLEWKAQTARDIAEAEKIKVQVSSPEWKSKVAKDLAEAEKIRVQVNSPEWKAAIQAQTARAQADSIQAMQNAARMQRQIADSTQLVARLEVPPVPVAGNGDQSKPIKVASGVVAGNKTGGANPVYPPEAKEKRIQGAVVLHAVISEAGTVEVLQVVSSPDPLLSKASVEAVQKWTYKPYLLNGNPTSVDTTITVTFSLSS